MASTLTVSTTSQVSRGARSKTTVNMARSMASVYSTTSKLRGRKTLYWRKGEPPPIPTSLENRRWHELQLDLARLNKEENSTFFDHHGKSIEPKPIEEPEKAFEFVLNRYIKFCLIAKKLDECYLYLVHPQKRALLRACIEAVMIRILELKNELMQIDQREYQFFEVIIQDYNVTYDDIKLQVPLFMREERAKILKDREKVLTMLFDKHTAYLLSKNSDLKEAPMTRREAILLIQRQTRYFLGVIKSEMAHRVLRPKSAEWMLKKQEYVVNKWRIHATRKETLQKKKELDRLLNIIPVEEPLASSETSVLDPLALRNLEKARVNQEAYVTAKTAVESDLFQKAGPFMAWNLHYNIKQWLLEVRDILGKFPPFPEEDEGGSFILFSQREVADVAEELELILVNGKIMYPKVEKAKKPKKEKKVFKPSPWGPEGFEYIVDETDCMREMKRCTEEYREYWYQKDDSLNVLQTHDKDMVVEEARPVVEEWIREQVDELIRHELSELTYAIDREPRLLKKAEKKKSKKSDNKGRGKTKDPTADRTIEELFTELVDDGIIRYCPRASLDQFLGEPSYSGASMDREKMDPLPALADVRRMVTEFAVLPLSSQAIHENVPLIRKLLLAGVRSTGKKLLLRAICHETGATLFDLTPKNLEGKFDSPWGKKMLMHLIMKVGKAMEPSVFWVGDCETMFLKKKDKTDTSKPHQWVKQFQKTLKKGVKNGDRMMMIGTSSQPGQTKQKAFNKFFDRIIPVPYPDYPSRYEAWRHFISENIQQPMPPYFDLSSLTKVTTGYTMAAIKETCAQVLTEQRIAKFMFQPMQPSDFINQIWRYDPIYREEHEQFLAWYNATPLAKLRQEWVHADPDELPAKKPQKKK